jgi:hypothetical protein
VSESTVVWGRGCSSTLNVSTPLRVLSSTSQISRSKYPAFWAVLDEYTGSPSFLGLGSVVVNFFAVKVVFLGKVLGRDALV